MAEKLSAKTVVTSLARSDRLPAIGDPGGTPANELIDLDDFSKSLNYAVNVLDYGAVADDTTDNATAFQAAVDALSTDEGGRLLIPPGKYYFATGINLGSFTGDDCNFLVEAWGAELRTDAAISIFYANVTDNTDANIKIGRKLNFFGGTYKGDETSGQKAIEIDAMYTGILFGVQFNNLDTAVELSFCLNTTIMACRSTSCATDNFVAQSGSGKWTGATTSNSQSNQTTFVGCRVNGQTSATSHFKILAASGVEIRDCITEGGNPVDAIHFDAQGSSTVKDFRVTNHHSECSPTNAVIKYDGAGGYFKLDGIFLSASTTYVLDCDGAAQCEIAIKNVPTNNWTTSFVKTMPANGSIFLFEQFLSGAADVTSVSGTTVFPSGLSSNHQAIQIDGVEIRGQALLIGSPDYANVTNPNHKFRGAAIPDADNDAKCFLGATSDRWRSIHVGTGDSRFDGDVSLIIPSASATAIANSAATINTTNKAQGRWVRDSTNFRIMVARGANATDPWDSADGGTTVTPST